MALIGLLTSILSLLQSPPAQVPAYWGSLTPGAHGVGFRQYWVIDSTRRLPPGPVAGPAFRPVLVNVWYPSSARSGAPMPYRDYLDGAVRAASEVPGLSSYARLLVEFERGIVTEELAGAPPDSLAPERRRALEQFLGAPTAARRDAPMASGAFPIVIYFQGARSSYEDNVALCEYLASRGYVVLGSAYPAEDNQTFATNAADHSRERDARRLLIEARRLPSVDPMRVTVIGHSAGAQAAILFSADSSAPIHAVLSLDTTQDYWPLSDLRWTYYTEPVIARRKEITGPFVFFAAPRAMFELADSLSAARRWYVTVRDLEHNDFITQGVVHRELTATTPAERARAAAARRAYDGIVRFIGAWLTAEERNQPLAASSGSNEGTLQVVEVPVGQVAPALSGSAESSPRLLRHQLSTRGPDETLAAIRRARDADSASLVRSMDVATALVAKGAWSPDPVLGRRLYEGLVAIDTAYRGVFRYARSLARYWDSTGDSAQALTWWRLAATIEPSDTTAARRIRQGSPTPGAPAMPAMQRAVVAQTKWFRFHSDSLMALHDWLNWRTSGLPDAPAEACPSSGLPGAEWHAFERAQGFYAGLRGRDRDRYLLAIRYELAGFPGLDLVADSLVTRASGLLRDALPAYLACWWREQDRRNRDFIAQLVPALRIHEDSIAARLARAYQTEWSGQFPVDLVAFATATGANSVVDPNHILMSSIDSSYRGASGIEMVFHEASHSVVDSGRDIIRRLLRDSTVTGGARLPRELSHVLLFYSVGRITADILGEAGLPYEPYMSREGLWQRAWPRLRAPVEQYWQGYLAGRTTARDAMIALIKALPPG